MAEVSFIEVGDTVEKVTGDYRFYGIVRARFTKQSGAIRFVVENPDGILHIFSPVQLQLTNINK